MSDPKAVKADLRRASFARRQAAHDSVDPGPATERLLDLLGSHAGRAVSGYLPIRTEIDPRPAMTALARLGPVCVPVIDAPGRPLMFRQWQPGCALVPGPFGAEVPKDGDWLQPEVLIVPLVAFDDRCNRLGYGGGYYDRTLAGLRARGPALAIGLAYQAQISATPLPMEATDIPLDAIVTEAGLLRPPG